MLAGPGRPKGSLNLRSKQFLAVLEKHNFCAASAMIECYQEARKVYDNYGTIYDAICDARVIKNDKDGSYPAPPEDNAHKYLKIAADMAKDLASYSFPKLKAIEQTQVSATEGMTPVQKLEAMRHAVNLLELQIQQGKENG